MFPVLSASDPSYFILNSHYINQGNSFHPHGYFNCHQNGQSKRNKLHGHKLIAKPQLQYRQCKFRLHGIPKPKSFRGLQADDNDFQSPVSFDKTFTSFQSASGRNNNARMVRGSRITPLGITLHHSGLECSRLPEEYLSWLVRPHSNLSIATRNVSGY